LQILPSPEPDSCRLRADAFERDLAITGLSPVEMASFFGAAQARPDPELLAARGPISARLDQDEPIDTGGDRLAAHRAEGLNDGQALLASGQPGQARLHAAFPSDRLLPGPLNLLLAQQWARQGLFPLHAAALRWGGHGVLILGGQGSGKSSLILAALAQGAAVISDDWLLVGSVRSEARAERLRRFLMFRPGASWDRFGPGLADAYPLRASNDGRFVHAIEQANPAFPEWTRLDRCVVLGPPDGPRPGLTTLDGTDQARLLAALIDAAMPILMTARFPVERALLFDRFKALSQQLPVMAATTGLDLLTEPRSVLERLSSDPG
jgi:hypothetical protein